ncbi:hypothetical protein AVEN_7334-1 [Araneus ventricosus]|uniref:Uncharacterized protein n=1 Tax=Araneus ventricosus TaxID=182803 RepID=A0A4Y2BQN1_ARAVE|nr:hypothetical protein AVEN_7334-1 [Araneus ventricosus]
MVEITPVPPFLILEKTKHDHFRLHSHAAEHVTHIPRKDSKRSRNPTTTTSQVGFSPLIAYNTDKPRESMTRKIQQHVSQEIGRIRICYVRPCLSSD